MHAILSGRALLLPFWAGVGACSLVVDTSPINAESCGPLERSCDGACRELDDPGYGCGRCQVCEFESVQGQPTGYARFECVAKTSSHDNNMAPTGAIATYTCNVAEPTCMDGFHGERCQYPDNDFTGFLCPDQGCEAGKTCMAVRPGVSVCL